MSPQNMHVEAYLPLVRSIEAFGSLPDQPLIMPDIVSIVHRYGPLSLSFRFGRDVDSQQSNQESVASGRLSQECCAPELYHQGVPQRPLKADNIVLRGGDVWTELSNSQSGHPGTSH